MMRAVVYVGAARGSADERGLAAFRRLRATMRDPRSSSAT
jgi:hypothetical protein